MTRPVKAVTTIKSPNSIVSRLTPSSEKKAGELLESSKGSSTAYTINERAAQILEDEIPGFKVSLGEARNDPGLIKLQRALVQKPGEAADIYLQRKANNLKAIRDYLSQNFSGEQGIQNVVKQLETKASTLDDAVTSAQSGVKSKIGKLKPVDPQATGVNIRESIETQRKPVKAAVEDMYNNISNEPITNVNTSSAIADIEKTFRPGDESVYPTSAIARVKEALRPKGIILGSDGQIIPGLPKSTIDFQDLHSLRKDIGRQMWDAERSGNRELSFNLGKIKQAIDADIEVSMGSNNAYVAARNAYADYAKRFRSGATGTVMKKGSQFTGLSTPEGVVGNKFATLDGADDLIRAIGKNNASTVMEGHFANDLLKGGEDITQNRLASWLSRNRKVLDKYGLTGQFDDIAKAQQTLDAAKNLQTQYGKSIAWKILNADPEKAIASAMSGANSKNTAVAMTRLIQQMGGNKDAIMGLKNAFKDFIVRESEQTVKTIAGDEILGTASFIKAMEKYKPAMEILYKDEPKKLNALRKVQQAIETQGRSAASPIGGGSDTAANLAHGVAAKTFTTLLNHTPSTKVNLAMMLVKKGLGAINELTVSEANTLAFRAMYDPDLAETLLLARNNAPRMVVERRIKSHIAKMGIVSGVINRFSGSGNTTTVGQ